MPTTLSQATQIYVLFYYIMNSYFQEITFCIFRQRKCTVKVLNKCQSLGRFSELCMHAIHNSSRLISSMLCFLFSYTTNPSFSKKSPYREIHPIVVMIGGDVYYLHSRQCPLPFLDNHSTFCSGSLAQLILVQNHKNYISAAL